ncbi:hypothetical protein RchiOBHm_Chr4g0387071 [Rosa chinensis]|uniref:Uncharacterized protein n=1 Tax=Rosa chinensis TaxID=74649 RepID=A0A2P6QPC3_ROSCH|nr:hypothetical protein RchiOBHm_Chr4g0387071 [Rosa chinensis]
MTANKLEVKVAGPYGLPLTPARRALFIVYRTALPYVGERISSRSANLGILLADSQSDEVYSFSAQSSSITRAASSSTPPASVSALKRLKQRLNELWLSAVRKWPTVHL